VLDELREHVMHRVKKRMTLRSKAYIFVEGLEQNEAGKLERKEDEKALNLLSNIITDFLGLSERENLFRTFPQRGPIAFRRCR
jgi:hypothetical protein